MQKELSGKIALVTGSGRGLGFAMAKKIAAMGADVIVHDLSLDAPATFGENADLGEVVQQIEKLGVRVMAVTGNIGEQDAVAKMKADIMAEFGRVDILVNCAGGDIGASGGKPVPNDVLGIPYEDIVTLTNNNLIGTMLVTQAFVPDMVARQSGIVVNIGSVAANAGYSNGAIYACLKAAVVHYTRCLAAEVINDGVRVNAVNPGPAKTARFQATRTVDPAKMNTNSPSFDRYAEPDEIADAVCWLVSSGSKFVHGQVIRVDGGLTLYPG